VIIINLISALLLTEIVEFTKVRKGAANIYEVNDMKKIKRSIISTLILASICLLVFTDTAYADVSFPIVPILLTRIIPFGIIILIIIYIALYLINRINNKDDNNKPN